MPKKRLTQIAKEVGMDFDEIKDMVDQFLEDDMVSGGRGIVWINENGQEILERAINSKKQTSAKASDPSDEMKSSRELAEEYGVDVDQINAIIYSKLDESMVATIEREVYVNSAGMLIIDETVSMPTIHRGLVTGYCPNKNYVWTRLREKGIRVAVKVPLRIRDGIIGKMIYFTETINGNSKKYKMTRP